MSDLFITATDYHAHVLAPRVLPKRQIGSLRQWGEKWLKSHSIQLMSSAEEYLLWQDLLQDVDFPDQATLIQNCIEADHLLQLYQIPSQALNAFDSDLLRLFKINLNRFEAQLQTLQKTTFLRGLQKLLALPIPIEIEQIEFYGFVDFPPLYQSIINHLQQQGIEIIQPPLNPAADPIPAMTHEAPTPEIEFLTALQWIEQDWRQHPDKKFALVVQQSTLPWHKIHRLLKTHSTALQISCSKGEALSDQPQFLFLTEVFQSLEQRDLLLFSRVLISPFWPDDLPHRIQLDRWMREYLPRVIGLPEMLKALLFHAPEIQHCLWYQTWSKLMNFEAQTRDEFIRIFLSAVQFKDLPTSVLPEFADLHIIGTLEAAYLPVDTIWLLSADRHHYPLKKNSSILPNSLLAKYGVPVELAAFYQYGHNLVHAICDQRQVYASWVPMIQGEPTALSRLFSKAASAQSSEISIHQTFDFAHPQSPALAPLPQLPLAQTSEVLLKSGTQLLKEQAECPFKAFAHFRLKVKGFKTGQTLLDPLQKGSLVHAVLDQFWQKLQSQQQLNTLSEAELQQEIVTAVDSALQTFGTARKRLLQKLERQRLIRLLTAWVELEKQRPPFKVKASEVNALVHLNNMQFQIRLDRIDEVQGQDIIIDYKTGEVSAKHWFEPRLRDPQLPIYAITHPAAGAVFASLKIGKMGFSGIVESEALRFGDIELLKSGKTWLAQRQEWQTQLETLMQEFQAGRLDVAPIDPKACQYCDLAGLCRIKEIQYLTVNESPGR